MTRAPGYLARVEPGELDAERFEQLVDEGSYDEALGLWRGPALADLAGEEFAYADAARLDEARRTADEARIAAELEAGSHVALTAELEALVAAHPHRERLRAQQMLALYRSGRQADALAAYRDARTALDELGLEPSAELRVLEQRILRHDPDLDLAVPPETTPLIGRELEVAAVRALLGRSETRLVTLTGPGGTGKTRLAIAAATDSARVVFVDLSPVSDPALVLATAARAIGAPESRGGNDLATLVEALAGESTLLVLDNFEQVLDAASDVARLVAAVPPLQVIVTSRAPLRIAVERVYAVPPLPIPEAGEVTATSIARTPAVRLYAERASATDPRFAVTDENATAVARICRALDGLPLALELRRRPARGRSGPRDRGAPRRAALAPFQGCARPAGAAALAPRHARLERPAARRRRAAGARGARCVQRQRVAHGARGRRRRRRRADRARRPARRGARHQRARRRRTALRDARNRPRVRGGAARRVG